MENVRTLLFMDSILDTRLAVIKSCNPTWAEELLQQGYKTRLTNRFSYILSTVSDQQITSRWVKRDSEILKIADPTEILHMFSAKRKENELLGPDHPKSFETDVTLNTWPYKLSASEINDFKTCLQELFITEHVNVIYRDIKVCTPLWIRDNFDNVYFFDMNEWLVIHAQNLDKNKVPDVVFTFPLCLLDEVDPNGKNPKEIIDYMALTLSKHFTVDVLPLKCFSSAI